MIQQLDLLGGPPVTIDADARRLARSSDPVTSYDAARRARSFADSHCDIVLKVLKRFGRAGAEQIAAATDMDSYQVRKRLADLQRRGQAKPLDDTRLTVSGCKERIWVAA